MATDATDETGGAGGDFVSKSLLSSGILAGGLFTKFAGVGLGIDAASSYAGSANKIIEEQKGFAQQQTALSGQKNTLTTQNIQSEIGIETARQTGMENDAGLKLETLQAQSGQQRTALETSVSLQKRMIELNAFRQNLETTRGINAAVGAARAQGANTGTLFSSSQKGKQAGIQGGGTFAKTGTQQTLAFGEEGLASTLSQGRSSIAKTLELGTRGIQQGLETGRQVFGFNKAISENKIGLANLQYQSDVIGYQKELSNYNLQQLKNEQASKQSTATGLASLGGSIASSAGPLADIIQTGSKLLPLLLL